MDRVALKWIFVVFCLFVCFGCNKAPEKISETNNTPLIALPPQPYLSGQGYQLILDYEVGGGESYYNKYLNHPTWPGADSGVTIGIGYDLGYNSVTVFKQDWRKLKESWIDRLAKTIGVKGASAKSFIPELKDILIQWKLAEGVFNEVTLARFYQLTKKTFPGMENLDLNAQAVLVSLVFNRGGNMAGPSRLEMRNIRDLVPKKDYKGMAAQIRNMKRLWVGKGLDGLLKRRDAEAKLMESCAKN